MPTARNHAAIGVVNGKIYVIGGRLAAAYLASGSDTDVVEQYDPAADSWGAAGLRMPIARSGMGWATFQDRIYIAGGQEYDAHIVAAIRAVRSVRSRNQSVDGVADDADGAAWSERRGRE